MDWLKWWWPIVGWGVIVVIVMFISSIPFIEEHIFWFLYRRKVRRTTVEGLESWKTWMDFDISLKKRANNDPNFRKMLGWKRK